MFTRQWPSGPRVAVNSVGTGGPPMVPLVSVCQSMGPPGQVSVPNGLGVAVTPNELTSSDHRDPSARTPHSRHVPARLGPLATTRGDA
jgi:hypothetical protein